MTKTTLARTNHRTNPRASLFFSKMDAPQALVDANNDAVVVDTEDDTENTPLHTACRENGTLEMVRLLCEKGASLEVRNGYGNYTALHFAIESGHLGIVQYLLDKGAVLDPQDEAFQDALYSAAFELNTEVVQFLIDNNHVDVNFRWSQEDSTPFLDAFLLHIAIPKKNMMDEEDQERMQFISMLVERGASLVAEDSWGCNALHLAVFNKSHKVVSYLIDKGADVESRNDVSDHKTVLELASWMNDLTMVRLLLQKKATATRQALMNATETSHYEITRALILAGADLNTLGDEDWTLPIHSACGNGCMDIVRLLVDAGSDLGIVDMDGETPYTIASEEGFTAISEFLDSVKTSKEHRRWLWERRQVNMRKWRWITRIAIVLKPWHKDAQERAYAPGGLGYEEVAADFAHNAKRQCVG